MAVIKGNAYGHGIIPVARALSDADAFGVARLAEAIALRDAGIDHPLVLLGGVLSRDDLDVAVSLHASPCVHSNEQISWLEKCKGSNITVWLKVDTGMNRLGFHIDDAAVAISRLRNCAAVSDLRIMTHFSNADDVDDKTTRLQVEKFSRVIDGFGGHVSVANSAGLFGWTDLFASI